MCSFVIIAVIIREAFTECGDDVHVDQGEYTPVSVPLLDCNTPFLAYTHPRWDTEAATLEFSMPAWL